MTFQEAQAKFSGIVSSINPAMSPPELEQKQTELLNLLVSLPNTPEFNPISTAIGEFSPKLAGQVTMAVVKDIQSRDGTFKEASGLLTQVATKAEADARTLTFEKPKIIAAGLTEAMAKIQELRGVAKAGNLEQTASKVEALATLVQHLHNTIKAA